MRQALGRGLDALISKTPQEQQSEAEGSRKIPIGSIRPNKFQPRRNFDPERLAELAQSIKEHGLTQPIVVSWDPQNQSYEIIAGERRLKAAQLAGLSEIEAVVRPPLPDQQRLALSIVENIQREDLNAMEAAHAYRVLTKEFGISQTDLAQFLGKSKPAVSNTLRLLDLPEDIQKAVELGEISEGHARALLSVDNPVERKKIFFTVLERKLSVRDAEEAARRANRNLVWEPGVRKRRKQDKPADILALESDLQRILGTRVKIRVRKDLKSGAVVVYFFTPQDFERIVGIIKNEGK